MRSFAALRLAAPLLLAALAMPAAAAGNGADTVEVTLTEGTNMAAALSPDGRSLVIAVQGVLWSLPAEGGTATPLTAPELDAHEPVWAPDGSRIAFYAFADDGFAIWSMAPDGSDLARLTEPGSDARYPSYAGSAEQLLFASDAAGGYGIYALGPESALRPLTTAAETGYQPPTEPYFSGSGNAVYPMLSPDGSRLAFVVDGEQDRLVVRDPAPGAPLRTLYRSALLGAPAWAPDGESLYVVGVEGATSHLARVPLDGPPERVVDGGDVFPFRPSFAPDGSLLYTADGGIRTLSAAGEPGPSVPFAATVTLDRTPYQRRSYDFTDTSPRRALGLVDPVLSPDGSRVAFVAVGDLWLAEVDGGEARRLTDDVHIDLSPSWSPDGKRLAFVSDRDGKSDVWVLSLESGAAERLTDGSVPLNAPVWSPDGGRIAFLANVINSIFIGATVNVLDLATGSISVVSEPIFGPSAPAWSPDGQTLAVYRRQPTSSRFREGHNALYLLPADGKGAKRWVTPVPGRSLGRRQFIRPAWSSTGLMVYRLDGGLWAASLATDGSLGEPRQIAAAGENPSFSADGSTLIYLDGADLMAYDLASGRAVALDVAPTWRRALPAGRLTVRAGRLFDGTGEPYRDNVDIVVDGGVITGVTAAGGEVPAGDFIDASGQVVMPGLIESHTHQSTSDGVALGELWLCYGITTVQETGTDPYYAVERREAEAAGRRPAPRLFTAGPLNEGARVAYGVSETVGTEALAEDSVRRSTELELDLYKSYVRQDYTVQKRVVELAHASGIPVTSHELYPAVAHGVDQMEHFGATSRRGYSLKLSRLNRSYQDVIALINRSGVVVTPTLALASGGGERDIRSQQDMLMRIIEGGGRIVAGTDSPFVPHGDALHRELAIYVDAGLPPARALRTAMADAADALGAGDQLGRIAAGYMADLVILDGDPLNDIDDTRSIDRVIKNGEVVCSDPTP